MIYWSLHITLINWLGNQIICIWYISEYCELPTCNLISYLQSKLKRVELRYQMTTQLSN